MKISVSLPVADIAFLDSYVEQHGIGSRWAVIQYAVDRLRHDELGDAYEQAWSAWHDSADLTDWERVAADGLTRP